MQLECQAKFVPVASCELEQREEAYSGTDLRRTRTALVEVGEFVDRVGTADSLFFRTGKPWKPIFEQCEDHLHNVCGWDSLVPYVSPWMLNETGRRREARNGAGWRIPPDSSVLEILRGMKMF
jgi:hypothetical protein